MAHDSIPNLRTPGRIADEIGATLNRVTYVLATRPHIRPAARAGVIRLYDRQAVAEVLAAIQEMDARRVRRAGAQ